MGIAEANNVSRRQCVVTSIQPIQNSKHNFILIGHWHPLVAFLMRIAREYQRRSFRCEPATAAKPRCMI
jgi:hypothetical protein